MTRQTIITAARKLEAEIGLISITKAALCDRAGVPVGSFHHIAGESFTDFITGLDPTGGDPGGDVQRARAHATFRKASILASAMCLASEKGYKNITRAEVAEAAGVSPALVQRYFESMGHLCDSIMFAALSKDVPRIIAQGLADGNPIAATASDALKKRAANTLTES